MRVAWEASALLPPRTGVGRYALSLLEALLSLDGAPEVHLAWRSLRRTLEPEARARIGAARIHAGRFPPGPWLQAMWDRWGFPAIERSTGRVDLVHGLAAVLPASRTGARVLTVHDLDFMRHPERVHPDGGGFLRAHLPKVIGRITRVIVPSTQTADDCVELLGAERERVRVVPHGGAEEFATPPTEGERAELDAHFGGDLPGRFLLCVATLEPRKNIGRLLDALDALHARGGEVPELIVIGGRGWGDPAPLQRLSGDVQRRYRGIGHQSARVIRGLLHRAEFLVLPSLAEGFGLPVLEAMACGCPVVCSDLPVLREVSGGHARFFDPEAVDSIADALAAALADPEGERARATGGLAHIAGFTWERAAEATLGVYREAVEDVGKSP